MKKSLVILIMIAFVSNAVFAQDKKDKSGFKLVRFNNITEITAGFQIGKTSRVTSFDGGTSETNVAGYKIPAPRLASSFGILIGEIFYMGAGAAYTFQAQEGNNPQGQQVSVFGQSRLNFARGRIRPFADFKGGYQFASFKEASQALDPDWYKWDGFFLEPSLGLSFKLGGHALLNTSLGYQFVNAGNRIEQTIQDENGNTLVNAVLQEKYHRFLLSVGFTFQ